MTKNLSIFRKIASDEVVCLALDGSDVHKLAALLAESAELSREPLVGNAWQNHILELILGDENVFTKKSELCGLPEMGESLIRQVEADLTTLRGLYDLTIDLPNVPIDGFVPIAGAKVDAKKLAMKEHLHTHADWTNCVHALAEYYSRHGAGEFGRYRAFRWGGKAGLVGVESPDPIRLSDLVEYDWQRDAVRRNTLKLLRGLPASNMLLYGDRGTGKSSSVKAMLNEFSEERLCIVEVAKEHLLDLPYILARLRKRPEKYILFLDDLSFEEDEHEYKALKAVLEGGLEARPNNLVLYATSNRRNLIRERFSERKSGDEVHPGDTMQEKLSLADRFGLKVPFLAPSQEEYLRMVATLAEHAGLTVTDEFKKQATAWQHARSGRAARQFVEYMVGEAALGC